MANKSIMQTVKDTTPQDVLLTGVFAGVLAGISGVGNYIDKNITSYTMGFKSTLKPKELFLRGALVGGIIALPFASGEWPWLVVFLNASDATFVRFNQVPSTFHGGR